MLKSTVMKRIACVAVALIFLSASCKKECSKSEKLSGNWKWVMSSALVVQTPQNSGRTWQLSFSPDLTVVQSGTLFPPATGTYNLQNGNLQVDFPSIGTSTVYQLSYRTADTLLLDQGAVVDLPLHTLVRN